MPLIIQAFFIIGIAVIQFAAIFWFLSRGGTDVYFPDDIKTRFSDVWGQDAVLERVKENIVYLEDLETIEDHPVGGSRSPPRLLGVGGGNGLAGMRARVEQVGGAMTAGPTGQGWRVDVEVPA